ncbi:hypothetical protein [Argonema antarcticum]|uniref:hypothetical protein n=1 Tax=Argonema antarcticum TaxID=2942763 RepID=UPI0020135F4D|nr:hypothetical protein [Argonema antarcticum]
MMASQTRDSEYSRDFFAQAEQELVQALLQDERTYCWNTAYAESEAYFAQQEEAFSLDDWKEADIQARTQNLFAQLDQVWLENVPEIYVQTRASDTSLLAALCQRFEGRIPQVSLEALAKTAKELMSTNLCLAERLVQCVQQLALGWGEEDLLVMARPLAYTMRGEESEVIDSVLLTVRSVPFCELSKIEQARLSLAIARYAFAELETTDKG